MRDINIGSVTMSALEDKLFTLYKGKHPILITGPVGIGKSSIIKSFAEKNNLGISIVYLSQMTPADIRGIPVPVLMDRTMEWFPPDCFPLVPNKVLLNSIYKNVLTEVSKLFDFFIEHSLSNPFEVNISLVLQLKDLLFEGIKNTSITPSIEFIKSKIENNANEINPIILSKLKEAFVLLTNVSDIAEGKEAIQKFGGNGGIIFLDEILSVTDTQVQIAANQLILEGRIGDYELLPNWVVWGAGNRREHGMHASYNAATLDRLTHFNLTVSLTDWLEYAEKKGISFFIRKFLSDNPGALHGGLTRETTGDKLVFPTPRSWEVVNDFINQFGSVSKASTSIEGRLGSEVANSFLKFARQAEQIPDISDLLACDTDEQIQELLKKIKTDPALWALGDKLKSYIKSIEGNSFDTKQEHKDYFMHNVNKCMNILNVGSDIQSEDKYPLPWGEVQGDFLHFLINITTRLFVTKRFTKPTVAKLNSRDSINVLLNQPAIIRVKDMFDSQYRKIVKSQVEDKDNIDKGLI